MKNFEKSESKEVCKECINYHVVPIEYLDESDDDIDGYCSFFSVNSGKDALYDLFYVNGTMGCCNFTERFSNE